MNELEGTYSSIDSTKRRQDVLERLRAGISEKRIATDLGIAPFAVSEIARRLHEEGVLGGGGHEAPTAEAPSA